MGSAEVLSEIIASSREASNVDGPLREEDIWSRHTSSAVWRARRFVGRPHFYPVYRCGDLYSFSPVSLILHKGYLDLDMEMAAEVERSGFQYYSGRKTVDAGVRRLGGPLPVNRKLDDRTELVEAIVEAMREDVRAIERGHPGCSNVVLCGGMDSQNLLLLPWENPTIAASAPPNYELVRTFVQENQLGIDVIRLHDDASLTDAEILVNCCRNNLEHCRWGPDLKSIAKRHDRKVVFWKGQLADVLLTGKWKRYAHGSHTLEDRLSRILVPVGGRGRSLALHLLAESGVLQRRCYRAHWDRGAMWQGAHMSIIRQLTGALALSAYHGPAARRVLQRADLRAVGRDLRPQLGERLYGKPVAYPTSNPSPPRSEFRAGISHLSPFLQLARSLGIRVKVDA